MPTGKSYLTVDELAELLGVGASTIYDSIKETGEACAGVPAIKVRSRIVIPRKPVERILAGLSPAATELGDT